MMFGSDLFPPGRIATGGIGIISCANVLLEGKPMGMLYEKTQDGDCYKTATLVVGNSMGPASILGKQASQTLPDGALLRVPVRVEVLSTFFIPESNPV